MKAEEQTGANTSGELQIKEQPSPTPTKVQDRSGDSDTIPAPRPPQAAAVSAPSVDQVQAGASSGVAETAVVPTGLADLMEQEALKMKEPELRPSDLEMGAATAAVATH
eukprot:11526116-Karenia_brevis.AAC.1